VKPLIQPEEIREAVERLGRQLASDYSGRTLTVVGVLTGSVILLADLVRAMDLPLRIALIRASSYRGAVTRPGELAVDDDLLSEVAGRDVLLVDDIFDTGHTLDRLLEMIRTKSPSSLKSAVLLWKQDRCEVSIAPDYHCFKIPDVFVVGYGLDYNDEYRHLPYIASLEESDLESLTGEAGS
jgi:hypoxanthine phosphoribosyltransferase